MASFSLFLFFTFMTTTTALLVLARGGAASAAPLYSDSRWVVNHGGQRVKLACVNWVSHLDAVVAEGLSKQPLDVISKRIKSMGFNCVRLTWPLYLVTNDSYASLTVRNSFRRLGLVESIAAFEAKNPHIIDLTLIKAFQAVVKGLGDENLMVILDNHLTRPGWCCGNTDGNGFFGDEFFDPNLWIEGLTKMATIFRGVPNVVGMSLRNELRGPKQNVPDWFRYMPKGAEAVHAANPEVLVILSGLSFDLDLSFLRNKQVSLTFKRKLVYEAHWYGFSSGQNWVTRNLNEACGQGQGFPLFVSEFGMDLRGGNLNDVRYFHCLMAVAAELDFDWALWSLVGSYYIREGLKGTSEVFGVLDEEWSRLRNGSFSRRISALQSPFRGPGVSGGSAHKVMFHPLTGLCVSGVGPLTLGSCSDSVGWNYTNQQIVSTKKDTKDLCLQAAEVGKEVRVGNQCLDANSKWEMISDSKMHISSKVVIKDNNSTVVCLDVDSNNVVVTNACKCLSTDPNCDPTSQWFKLVDTTRA
ncbi:glycosyl hydrolase 5 family protein-like [Senna tora]|uniref:Glycosyl hydrolase 5 family protein-like n=1 Tax=Senna tora TaxID=362788 RepID=A0A834WXR9_9FABA|nr:glycosyl hydrolase 5 family protein-like [Senna tora]